MHMHPSKYNFRLSESHRAWTVTRSSMWLGTVSLPLNSARDPELVEGSSRERENRLVALVCLGSSPSPDTHSRVSGMPDLRAAETAASAE